MEAQLTPGNGTETSLEKCISRPEVVIPEGLLAAPGAGHSPWLQ
jgi:hypothetical protein